VIHLTLQQLSAFLDGELTSASTELIRRHLSECDACTLRFGRIEAQEEVMARILVDEPGDAFFVELGESIATGTTGGKPAARPTEKKRASVADRRTPVAQPAPLPSSAPAPPAPDPETRPILYGRRAQETAPRARGERRAMGTLIVAIVICVIVASVAWIGFHRDDGSSRAVLRSDSERPSPPVEPAAPESPPPAAIAPAEAPPKSAPTVETPMAASVEVASESAERVALETAPEAVPATVPIVAPEKTPPKAPVVAPEKTREKPAKRRAASDPMSDGWLRMVVPGRPEPTFTTKPPAPAPERLVERPAQNVVPVRTIITETIVAPADQETGPPPPAATPQAPAEISTTRLIQEARSASLRAAKSKDPLAFDGAASAWEQAMPASGGSPEDLAMARRELAQARFQAWALSPSAARREAAITAARAYLLYAPPGPERDQAWTWLGRLKH